MTWSRLSVEPTEFAISLKWSFHKFAILLSLEVPPTVSDKDSFLGLCALICFQKSLHSPLWSFDYIDWESWTSFSLKNFISCQKAACAIHFRVSDLILGQFRSNLQPFRITYLFKSADTKEKPSIHLIIMWASISRREMLQYQSKLFWKPLKT